MGIAEPTKRPPDLHTGRSRSEHAKNGANCTQDFCAGGGLAAKSVAFARTACYAADARDVAGGHAEGARTPLAPSQRALPIAPAGAALGRVGLEITHAR